MALERYKAKRNFQKTPEPAGDGKPRARAKSKGRARAKKRARAPIFVVQEHHASHLHYDFRLEAEGVLKSWAVPKGPSLDPSEKRLAVQVEDHPLAYASFKGKIPEGQYGAGTVLIWDHGTYDNLMAQKPEPLTVPQAIEAGHLEFALHGTKLNGRFALIRMHRASKGKKTNWLLIKMKEDEAEPDEDEDDEDEQQESEPASRPRAAKTKAKAKKARSSASSSGSGTRKGRATKSPKSPKTASRPKRKAASRGRAQGQAQAPRTFTEFTHTDKVMFPEAGITKGDVIAFYDRIADRLLPYLRDRPATLERLPDGLSGPDAPHFWQKDVPESYPDWLPRAALESEQGKTVHYALVNDRASLFYLVNQGTLTFHVWFSRVENLDRPDFVLFDLDPGKARFADAVAVARHLHEQLASAGHDALVKTSGKSGLHVLVPWADDGGGYDEARAWAHGLAVQAADALPDLATAEIRKARRGNRVYIDVMQNARGHHAVPPYVLRPTPTATVSTPLDWREVTPDLDPKAFTLETIFRRRDPWPAASGVWGAES